MLFQISYLEQEHHMPNFGEIMRPTIEKIYILNNNKPYWNEMTPLNKITKKKLTADFFYI